MRKLTFKTYFYLFGKCGANTTAITNAVNYVIHSFYYTTLKKTEED